MDILHRSTLRSIEVKHRKRGRTDLKTNRHVLDKIGFTVLTFLSLNGEHYHVMLDHDCLLYPKNMSMCPVLCCNSELSTDE